jgi:hypothetical protein
VAQKTTGAKTLVSTVDFLAAAQRALDECRPLDLILLALHQEDFGSNLEARFRSDDATSGARPVLSLAYTPVPEPSGFLLTAFPALAALVVARRRARRPTPSCV